MKKEYFCDIYVAPVKDVEDSKELYPKERADELKSIKNERVRREKYSVWRLLEMAISDSLGICMTELDIRKNENGKWVADGVHFSLSHAKDVVAVAVSSSAVGVDIEPVSALKNDISGRILTEKERLEYGALADGDKREYLIKKWTAKEAIFKSHDEATFRPEEIEVSENSVLWRTLLIGREEYICAVSGESIDNVVTFEILEI